MIVRRGEFVALMGPSGCGKTTLLNLIGATDVPSRGRLSVDGVDLLGLSDDQLADLRRDRIGIVFQFFNLIPTLTAQEKLFRMFLGEAVGLTLAAGVLGGGIGFCLAYLFIVQAAALIEVPVAFTMPYVTFAVTFVVSVLAGAVAAHLPTRRLLRRPAAEILRVEA